MTKVKWEVLTKICKLILLINLLFPLSFIWSPILAQDLMRQEMPEFNKRIKRKMFLLTKRKPAARTLYFTQRHFSRDVHSLNLKSIYFQAPLLLRFIYEDVVCCSKNLRHFLKNLIHQGQKVESWLEGLSKLVWGMTVLSITIIHSPPSAGCHNSLSQPHVHLLLGSGKEPITHKKDASASNPGAICKLLQTTYRLMFTNCRVKAFLRSTCTL